MDHPAIAKVFDAGFTPAGPALFCDGIRAWFAHHQLLRSTQTDPRQPSELFIQVCEVSSTPIRKQSSIAT